MAKIRVLVVDDSVVIRRLVTDILSGDAEIEVAGVAANGRIALDRIAQLKPDLVTLDIEMPEMDGLETLAAIRKSNTKLPVIMFSHLTERGAAATLDALSLGASDYVAKPANVGSITAGKARVREELIPKIKLLCGRRPAAEAKPCGPSTPLRLPVLTLGVSRPQTIPRPKIDILAIGVSTGGPNALAELLLAIRGDFPIPIVIVQHMPPIFTRLLADRLSAKAAITIKEGIEGGELRPGVAWLAPGNFHMRIQREGNEYFLGLNQDQPENSCRPAVDVLFRSVAAQFGAATLAAVLTGMGQDGLRGCEAIHRGGGQILAQDEASSVVWGMPGFVARAGLADRVPPLGQIGAEINRRVAWGRTAKASSYR